MWMFRDYLFQEAECILQISIFVASWKETSD